MSIGVRVDDGRRHEAVDQRLERLRRAASADALSPAACSVAASARASAIASRSFSEQVDLLLQVGLRDADGGHARDRSAPRSAATASTRPPTAAPGTCRARPAGPARPPRPRGEGPRERGCARALRQRRLPAAAPPASRAAAAIAGVRRLVSVRTGVPLPSVISRSPLRGLAGQVVVDVRARRRVLGLDRAAGDRRVPHPVRRRAAGRGTPRCVIDHLVPQRELVQRRRGCP